MKTILAAIVLTGSTMSAFAATPLQSATIPLTGGTASPGHPLNISLASLPRGIPYVATCTITNPNTENIIANFKANDAGSNVNLEVNGSNILSNSDIPAAKSVPFVARDVVVGDICYSEAGLIIIDLDTTNSLNMTNCV